MKLRSDMVHNCCERSVRDLLRQEENERWDSPVSPVTKRSVLELSAKFFDPVRLLTPFKINMKILCQDLFLERSIGINAWKEWIWVNLNCLLTVLKLWRSFYYPMLCQVFIDSPIRMCLPNSQVWDNSERAYPAVVYLRTEFSNGCKGILKNPGIFWKGILCWALLAN